MIELILTRLILHLKMIRSPKMQTNRTKYYDTHTLYVTAGVAREDQLHESLRTAIQDGSSKLNNELLLDFIKENHLDLSNETELTIAENNSIISQKLSEMGYEPPKVDLPCNIKVNLIVNKNGEYYGFGYVRVSDERVYWMLLGRNPDGSERTREYPDPKWVPPSSKNTFEQDQEKFTEMSWYEIAQEEDKYVQPIIREDLGPLMTIPGYTYDEKQYKHLQDVAMRNGKDPEMVPTMGYFEFSRAYSRDVEKGKEAHILCARQIPDWIPPIAFKSIFSIYVSDQNAPIPKNTNYGDIEELRDSYPIVTIINSKKESGRTVLITFDSSTKDAIFALLMTRKVRIVHPKYDKKSTASITLDNKTYKVADLKCTLIFDHAYEHDVHSSNNHRFARPDNRSDNRTDNKRYVKPDNRRYEKTNVRSNPVSSREPVKNRDDIDISKYNYTKKATKK